MPDGSALGAGIRGKGGSHAPPLRSRADRSGGRGKDLGSGSAFAVGDEPGAGSHEEPPETLAEGRLQRPAGGIAACLGTSQIECVLLGGDYLQLQRIHGHLLDPTAPAGPPPRLLQRTAGYLSDSDIVIWLCQ